MGQVQPARFVAVVFLFACPARGARRGVPSATSLGQPRDLAHDFARRFVLADALERGLPARRRG